MVVPGANALVTPEDVAVPELAKGDIAVSQFEIPLPAISAFFKRARAAGATTILNPAPAMMFGAELLDLVDVLVVNETELGFLANTELEATDDPARFIEASQSLSAGANRTICVTLGKRGVLALIDGEASMIAGRAVKAVDTTGAGDCFRRRACRATGRRNAHPRRARLRQCRSLDLRAADGRCAIDADGGRGSGFVRIAR